MQTLGRASAKAKVGAMQEAIPLAEQALAQAEQQVEDEADLVQPYLLLSTLLIMEGRNDDAETYATRANALSEDGAGPDHPETAKHAGNLGAPLIKRGQLEQGEALLQRALAMWDEQDAPDPVYTVSDICNLAELRLLPERPDDALALYARAVAIQEQAFGEQDPRLHDTLRGYVAALRSCGHDDQAAEVERRIPTP